MKIKVFQQMNLSSKVQKVNDDNGIQSDDSPNADRVAYESGVITQVQTGVLDQDLQSNIEIHLFVEPSATASGTYVVNDDGIETMPITESQTAKPFMVQIPVAFEGEEKTSQIFYGNDSFYLLFRFHQVLFEAPTLGILVMHVPGKLKILVIWNRFKDALRSLLNGSSDNSKFEDGCRTTIGAQSYILFTLDKLIHELIKRLQAVVTEEMVDNKLLQLYAHERLRNPDKFSDVVYHQNARFLLPVDNLYRIEWFLLKKQNPGVFLQRSKTKCTIGDESDDFHKSMEGLIMYDGLESKVNRNTMKVSYIFGSEDFMFRTRRRRKALYRKSLGNGASNGNGHKRKRKLMFSL